MNHGLSDRVRAMAREKYVLPAVRSRRPHFSIRVRDLMEDLREEGFPENHVPQICTALRTAKFLRDNGIKIEGSEGPPSGMSTTVVVRYRVEAADTKARTTTKSSSQGSAQPEPREESPKARSTRLIGSLKGLLKEEFAAYGGGEAFLRWVRGQDEAE